MSTRKRRAAAEAMRRAAAAISDAVDLLDTGLCRREECWKGRGP